MGIAFSMEEGGSGFALNQTMAQLKYSLERTTQLMKH